MASDILTLPFRPRHHPHLGLEASTVGDLRRRAGALLARPQRLLFFSLIAFTRGEAEQMVDFRAVPCRAGDVLFIAPQQVFQLRLPVGCEGCVVIYRPDFLPPDDDVGQLLADETGEFASRYSCADPIEREALLGDCEALLRAYQRYDGQPLSTRILGYQLRIILARLAHLRAPAGPMGADASGYAPLMKRFRALVEEQFRRSRSLSAYAEQLFCSDRTLQRAVASCSGLTGKAYIDARVMLEAKRLLAHTNDSVGAVAASLGFSEATNFVKYFQRHEGVTPERFRLRYR